MTASEEHIHPCQSIDATSDACGGRYPASWAFLVDGSLHHRRMFVIRDYDDRMA